MISSARAKRLYRKLVNLPSTNYDLGRPKISPYEMIPVNAVILDLGSKVSRGAYNFGRPPSQSRVLCLDLVPGEGVDIVADAHDMSGVVSNASIDCVVAISVFEHLMRPWVVIDEIHRVLKPGGIVYVNVPWVFPYHNDPEDFYRFSHRGLEVLCGAFERIESGYNRGPASSMAHLCSHGFALCLSGRSKSLYGLLADLLKWPFSVLKYADIVVGQHPMAHVIANGAFFLGRKSDGGDLQADIVHQAVAGSKAERRAPLGLASGGVFREYEKKM